MRWWAISEETLRLLLARVREGEDPDVLLVELYANAEVEGAE